MATGGQNEPETIDLWIIAKSYWDGGYCILGYDEPNERIRRPVKLSKAGEPQSWSYSEDFELRKKYQFELDSSRQEVLPHAMDDVVVTKASKIKEKELSEHELYKHLKKCVSPRAMDRIDDIFDGATEQRNLKRFVTEGKKQHSVGIFKCKKSELHCFIKWEFDEDNKSLKEKEMINLRKENCNCNYTGLDFSKVEKIIESKDNPEQEVFVLLSLGRPFNPDGKFKKARCYVLAVGLVKGPLDEESDSRDTGRMMSVAGTEPRREIQKQETSLGDS